MPPVEARLTSRKMRYAHGERLRLTVELANRSAAPIAAIVDGWRVWLPSPGELMVLLGVQELPATFGYFSFRPPRLRAVAPGARTRIQVDVGMPPVEAYHDATGAYVRQSLTVDADLRVTVLAGYVDAAFKPDPDGYRADFVARQQLAPPASTTVLVDPA